MSQAAAKEEKNEQLGKYNKLAKESKERENLNEKQISQKDEQIANLMKQLAQLKAQLENQEESKEEVKENEARGSLQLEVIEAKLERSTEMWGKQDPYAELWIRQQLFKTKTHTDGAKEPVWNETTTMDVLDPSDEMTVKVFDSDTFGKDDLICEGTINLSPLCLSTPVDDWFQLQFEGKPSGQIHLKTKYTPH